jgi:hypothetical protein
MVEVRIDGGARLRQVAADIRATGDKGLGRQMSRALDATTKPISAAIKAEAMRVMPESGGYREALTKSLRHRTSQRTAGRTAQLKLITYADGTGQRRDVESLEKGELRHPVYGRSRNVRGKRVPSPWAVTRIRPGFHERGTKNAGDEAGQRLGAVLDDFAARLAKG